MATSDPSLADSFPDDGTVASDASLAYDGRRLEQLISRYHAMVYGICFRFLGHRQDAEDATQETFTRLARYLERWDRSRPLEPYLKTIAGNRCRTALAKRRRFQPLDKVAEPVSDESAQRLRVQALREEVDRALKQIPETHRRAFELFHQESMSYVEIAEAMGCPLGSVKTWVHRARQELMQAMRSRS